MNNLAFIQTLDGRFTIVDAFNFERLNKFIFNNLQENLRVTTQQQNCFNRSKIKGASSKYKEVCWVKRKRKWRATIKLNGKNINIGSFASEVEAGKAYDAKAKELFGEFAFQNTYE